MISWNFISNHTGLRHQGGQTRLRYMYQDTNTLLFTFHFWQVTQCYQWSNHTCSIIWHRTCSGRDVIVHHIPSVSHVVLWRDTAFEVAVMITVHSCIDEDFAGLPVPLDLIAMAATRLPNPFVGSGGMTVWHKLGSESVKAHRCIVGWSTANTEPLISLMQAWLTVCQEMEWNIDAVLM